MKQANFRLALLFIDLFPLHGKKLESACNSQASKVKQGEKVREQSENTTI